MSKSSIHIPKFYRLIYEYVVDAIRFILQPKYYFDKIANEYVYDTLVRLLFYGLVFELITFMTFYALMDFLKIDSIYKVFGLVIPDIIIAIVYLPGFLLTGHICRPQVKIKMVVVYLVTFKFVYLVIPIIFYALFISFEHYVFAMLRAITYYLFIIVYIFLFPIIFTKEIKNRIVSCFVSGISFVLITIAILIIADIFPYSQTKMKNIHILYDPICVEYLDAFGKIKDLENDKFLEINDNMRFILMHNGSDGLDNNDMVKIKKVIDDNKYTIESDYYNKIRMIDNNINSYGFTTVKNMLKQKSDEITSALNVMKSIYSLTSNDGNNYKNKIIYIDSLSAHYKKRNENLKQINIYLNYILMFKKYGITIY